MKEQPANENPYATPRGDEAPTSIAPPLQMGEVLTFSGTVQRHELMTSLRSRFSWSGLMTLGIGALICFAAAPAGFFKPLRRLFDPSYVAPMFPRTNDTLGEQMGLMGVGFVALAAWHVFCCCTSWNTFRRERTFLKQNPALYRDAVSGWIGERCIYMRETNSEAWIAWQAVGHFQSSDQLIMVDWGAGVAGMTFLTESMFATSDNFQRARKAFAAYSPNETGYRTLAELDDYFVPQDSRNEQRDVLPDSANVIGQVDVLMTNGDAWMAICKQIPNVVLRSSLPLHLFFAFMFSVAFLLVDSYNVSAMWMAGIWILIMTLGGGMTLYQHVWMLRRPRQRLVATRTQFTADEMHVNSTTSYCRIPYAAMSVTSVNGKQITLTHRDTQTSSTLARERFRTDAEFLRVRDLLSQLKNV